MALFLLFLTAVFFTLALRQYSATHNARASCRKLEKEKEIILSFLHEIGADFANAIDLNSLLHSILSSAVRILKAESGAVFLMDTSRRFLRASVLEGAFPLLQEADPDILKKILSKAKYRKEYLKAQKIPIGDGVIGGTASSRRPCLIKDAYADRRIPKFSGISSAVDSVLAVPLMFRGADVLGVLVLINKIDCTPFTKTDLGLLQAMGDQASVSINNARFYKAILEKQKLDCDLSIASDIQRMLLPRECPIVSNWDISVFNKTAMEIGGDYYDFIDIGKDKLGVVMADVSGKSIPGALVMCITRSLLRSKAAGIYSANSVLTSVNELICRDIEQDMFISLAYLIIDTKTNVVTYARAGHEPLLLYRAKEAKCSLLEPKGMVLGMDCGPFFTNNLEEVNIRISPGDVILLYTDGITEAVNEKGEEFGINGLMDSLRISGRETAGAIMGNITERINRFTGHTPQQDDLTLAVLKLKKDV